MSVTLPEDATMSPQNPRWSATRAANEVLWTDLARKYEEDRRARPPIPGTVVFFGTSTLRLWRSLPKDFPEFPAIGIGLPAANFEVLRRYYDRLVEPLAPVKLVLYAGTTEAMKGRPEEQVIDGLDALISCARRNNAGLPVVLLSLIAPPHVPLRPRNYSRTNRILADYATRANHVLFADAATPFSALPVERQASLIGNDNIHFTREGFALFADLLRPFLVSAPVPAADTTERD